MERHEIIVSRERVGYWRTCCTCLDEAGPFEIWEHAHDSAINHSIQAEVK